MGAIRFVLNGAPVEVVGVSPSTTLIEWLRGERLTGTKEGCAEGDCGACTVALRSPAGGAMRTRAVNACIMPLPMVHGAEVVTVEGVGDAAGGRSGRLHPVQREMAERHASQCGFCTPGIVMALWCRDPGTAADAQATCDRLAGSLCRCTGYGPILDAAAAAARDADTLGHGADDAALAAQLAPVPALDDAAGGRRWIAPASAWELADARAQNPDARVIAGATDVGLWLTKRLYEADVFVSVTALRPLPADAVPPAGAAFLARCASPPVADGGVLVPTPNVLQGDLGVIGAAVTHARFAGAVNGPVGEVMRRFGGVQVRNAGTVGGNVANGSPIGDLPPVLIAAGAILELAHRDGGRTLPLEDFFIAYGRQDRRPGEYVRAVHVPEGALGTLTCHKVAKRFDSDISAVMMALSLTLDDGVVAGARLAFGGMAATPRRAAAAEAALVGRPYNGAAIAAAGAALAEDFAPLSDQRASAAYRLQVAKNLLRRDYLERTRPELCTRLAGAVGARVAA